MVFLLDSNYLLQQLKVKEIRTKSRPLPLDFFKGIGKSKTKFDDINILNNLFQFFHLLSQFQRIHNVSSVVKPNYHKADKPLIAIHMVTHHIKNAVALSHNFLHQNLKFFSFCHLTHHRERRLRCYFRTYVDKSILMLFEVLAEIIHLSNLPLACPHSKLRVVASDVVFELRSDRHNKFNEYSNYSKSEHRYIIIDFAAIKVKLKMDVITDTYPS